MSKIYIQEELNVTKECKIEVSTKRATNAYCAFLRKNKISYIIAGKEKVDCAIAVEKLKGLFGIETLMVSGGGLINWYFLEADLIDELSIVIAPVADGAITIQ